ncbi:NAD-dependent epimerase/dehydratase family protein [Providencia manganoxydans]|uniref:NAD-dependent epimerase/dehydratase family protein n=1 Tax=Providencia manganoxydans TaxID=2923283 RepID=UPI003AF39FB5
MKYLVTGVAGFIGNKTAEVLCQLGHDVIGVDNLNSYYDVNLKLDRLTLLQPYENFSFIKLDFSNKEHLDLLFKQHNFDRVIHLGAQAGVRYSIDNPMSYINSNICGFANILECCKDNQINHLIYASSSSVYGESQQQPFNEIDNVDHPASLYAATKKSNELLAHSYSHLYGIPTTGLRFFTVYGPWGRPDMAIFKFTKSILNKNAIDVYNNGESFRDFTYIDDIVEGIIRIQDIVPTTNISAVHHKSNLTAPYSIYNIGYGSPVKLLDFIHTLEDAIGMKAIKNLLPMQLGDVSTTWASTDLLASVANYKAKVNIDTGVNNFVRWYRDYYKV